MKPHKFLLLQVFVRFFDLDRAENTMLLSK